MHIYFSGIGGAGIGPLALIAKQAGFEVSGSDKKTSSYINYLKNKGIDAHIGQKDNSFIYELHTEKPIDWFVYTSALPLEHPNHPELEFVQTNNIKFSKRDEFLNYLMGEKKLKLIAAAGTHGKTTTTGMLIWLFKNLNIPISYSIGAKTAFCEMGEYNKTSEYFIYECDEFDRNFLAFQPFRSLISSVDWDHHEIYPTTDDYKKAFGQFINQSDKTYLYKNDSQYLGCGDKYKEKIIVVDNNSKLLNEILLSGLHNRKNAFLCVKLLSELTNVNMADLIKIISNFPGTSRRFEKISTNVYTDYAHTPEEIVATLQLVNEVTNKPIVAVYEPLTDRRQHYVKDSYKDAFLQSQKVYWLPSYLAREDPKDSIISPSKLIEGLSNRDVVECETKSESLKKKLQNHLNKGALIVFLAGGGGGSLDDWARKEFTN